MPFHKEQKLNEWVDMLHSIYGLSQNYSRTEYEILAHMSEVTGAFGKYLFKLKQPKKALEFLPKMFGWAAALAKKVKGDRTNFEEMLLTKYPCVCPYCVSSPCACISGNKPPIDPDKVRNAYARRTPSQGRSLNDFQVMFRSIYERSWGMVDVESGNSVATEKLQKMYTRLIEEISEVGEAVRFVHLYPSNFDNELADYSAWLFAFISCLHKADPGTSDVILVEDLLWPAYPGICMACMLDICDCRPSPVRELLSKPALGDLQYIDGLTQAANKTQHDTHVTQIVTGALPLPVPISAVRIDVDNFKKFNESPFSHGVGDETLKHIVNVIRQKVRMRDRVYRVGGDEFALLCPDLSAQETEGMIGRISRLLRERPASAAGTGGEIPPTITLSVGIAECVDAGDIKEAFKNADEAATKSKNLGKDRITIWSA
jgi:diguanylate cyclase (GGDEF)-like protein